MSIDIQDVQTKTDRALHYRYDFVDVPVGATIKDGRLIASGVFARAGVQTYRSRDGKTIKEFRPPEEVKASINEFCNLTVTLEHPPEFINAENIKKYIVGLTGDATFSEDLVRGELTLFDQKAIRASQTTHRQFSHGYNCIIEYESGVWTDRFGVQGDPGEKYEYDQIQRDIGGNHLSLVSQARAGEVATFDSASQERFDDANIELLVQIREDSTMDMVKLDMGKGKMDVPKAVADMYESGDILLKKDMQSVTLEDKAYLMPKDTADAVMKLKKEMGRMQTKTDSLDSDLSELQTRLEATKEERKDLQIKNDALEAKSKQLFEQIQELKDNPHIDEDKMQAELKIRQDTCKRAAKLIEIPDFDASKSAIEWKKDAIKELTPRVNLQDLSNDEIDVRFDTLEQVFSGKGGNSAYAKKIQKAGSELSNAVNNMQEEVQSPNYYMGQLPQDKPLAFSKKK